MEENESGHLRVMNKGFGFIGERQCEECTSNHHCDGKDMPPSTTESTRLSCDMRDDSPDLDVYDNVF